MQSITELFILNCVNNLIISCKYNKLIFESPRSKFKAKQNIQSGSKCGKSYKDQNIARMPPCEAGWWVLVVVGFYPNLINLVCIIFPGLNFE